MNKRLQHLQAALLLLGHTDEHLLNADGDPGIHTLNAWHAYQEAKGLKLTDDFFSDDSTLRRLEQETYSVAKDSPAIAFQALLILGGYTDDDDQFVADGNVGEHMHKALEVAGRDALVNYITIGYSSLEPETEKS